MAVCTWAGGLPVASAPVWQLEQLPSVCSWSMRTAGLHASVEWQAAQRSLLTMCVAGFGVAATLDPGEWQEWQSRGVPAKTASAWHDSHACSRCAPVSSKPVVR